MDGYKLSNIKFKFSNEKQRNINVGKKIDPIEANKRKIGRHQRNLVVNLTIQQLRDMHYPEAIQVQIYALKDARGDIIPPSNPEYYTTTPVTISLICSDVNPFPLARFNEYDLDNYVTQEFGKYIVSERVTEKEQPGITQTVFRHEGVLQTNEDTKQDNVNKHSFNVYTNPIHEQDLDYINEKYKILGYKINKDHALMKTSKTINEPEKFVFEIGEY